MTDQNREAVATYEYDSWGNVLKSDTKGIAADNPFGYAGYMYDKEIGMYYLIARYYNPEHGVFLSVDPDPYARPGQKKQGRENKEKKRKKVGKVNQTNEMVLQNLKTYTR